MSRDLEKIKNHLFVCTENSCRKRGADVVFDTLKKQIKREKLHEEIMLSCMSCLNRCGRGPIVILYPKGVLYEQIKKSDCKRLVKKISKAKTFKQKPHYLFRM